MAGEAPLTTRRNLISEFTPSESKATSMDVYLRVRTFTKDERRRNCQQCIQIFNSNRLVVNIPKDSITYKNAQNGGNVSHQFTFSQIFGPEIEQQGFYASTVKKSTQNFLLGGNCLMFAYGATNSGKTYTVQGTLNDPGIIPRSLDMIFNTVGTRLMTEMSVKPNYYDNIVKLSAQVQKKERQFKEHLLTEGFDQGGETFCTTTYETSVMSKAGLSDDSTASGKSCENFALLKDAFVQIESRVRDDSILETSSLNNVNVSLWVSFVEIYNEFIYDLLQPLSVTRSRKRMSLKLAEDKAGNVFVKGLQRVCVSSANEAIKLLIVGQKNLKFAVTKLNQNSSRSHCIFTIEMVRAAVSENPKIANICKLSFCDLAGSERYSKTSSSGDRLKEACNINTSLLVLGRCISALRSNQSLISKESLKLIPFRESKLTRLFQNFFMRRGTVSMVVNISPDPAMCDETIHVLKFSALAEKVVFTPQQELKAVPSKASILMAATSDRSSVPWLSPEESLHESDIDKDELWDYIEELREEIIKLKKTNLEQEVNIRKEVAEAAMAAIVENEKYYKERLEKQKEDAEDFAEKQIALFIEQTEASRKRRKDECSDSEDENEVLVETKKKLNKVECENSELKIENKMLQDEIKVLRQSNTRLSNCQAKLRRESSALIFDASYKEYKRQPSSIETRWSTSKSQESNVCQDAVIHQLHSREAELAERETQLLYLKEENSRLNALVQLYEQNLANQDAKKRRLTVDNINLKKELMLRSMQTLNLSDEKENVGFLKAENIPVKDGIPKSNTDNLKKEEDEESKNNEQDETTDEEKTPATVKKLYKPRSTLLLSSPLQSEDERGDIRDRVLEQIQF